MACRRTPLLVLLCTILVALSAAAPRETEDPLAGFAGALPACPDEAQRCVGVALHVVCGEGGPVQSAEWVATQLAVANRHFAMIGVGFAVRTVEALPSDLAFVRSAEDRDRLGAGRFTRGVVHVFLVEELSDIDTPDALIRGVHWREGRRSVKRRWVVLAKAAPDMVLAHELGHFFGLPHGKDPASIMNKTPRTEPPFETWSFTEREQRRMKRELRLQLRSGVVVAPRRKAIKRRTRRPGRSL